MTDISPMIIQNIAIMTAGIFHEELWVLKRGRLFLFTFYDMQFHVKCTVKFCQSVSPVFWCLFIGPPSNLPDMTGGPTAFREFVSK